VRLTADPAPGLGVRPGVQGSPGATKPRGPARASLCLHLLRVRSPPRARSATHPCAARSMLGIPATWSIAVFRIGLENLKIKFADLLRSVHTSAPACPPPLPTSATCRVTCRGRLITYHRVPVSRKHQSFVRLTPESSLTAPDPREKQCVYPSVEPLWPTRSGWLACRKISNSRRKPPGNSGGGRA
jgi:hypothetical protein